MALLNRKKEKKTLLFLPFLYTLPQHNTTQEQWTRKLLYLLFNDKCGSDRLRYATFKQDLLTESETPTTLLFYNVSSLQCTYLLCASYSLISLYAQRDFA